MKYRISVWVGFVAGFFFAAWLIGQIPRSAVYLFLQKPFDWIVDYIDIHIYPNESLGGMAIEIPFWFLYWGCLCALVCFLFQLLYYKFRRLIDHGDSNTVLDSK
jgi:hypothetical protein